MYVMPPDTNIYSIPRYMRCTKKNFGRYHVSEPPVEHLHDPLYKTEREIMKVFLTKHYRNRRADDSDFYLDFEEIYVIDSKTMPITRASCVFLRERKEIGEFSTRYKVLHKCVVAT